MTPVFCLSLPVPAPAGGGAREEGCGAFPAMLSGYVFGPSSNPARVNGEPLSPGGSIRVIHTRYPA